MDCDVAIIGAGPVGLTLANLLGRRGHSVCVLEKQTDPYPLPRAVHFDGEVMRVFQNTGLAAKILPHTCVGKGMLFKDFDGNLLVDWSREQSVGPMGWNESYRFYQPGLEKVLREGLKRFERVSLRAGWEVFDVHETDDGVALTIGDGAINARYVVGCDGAQSATRARIGAKYRDLGFHERWLVVDVLLNKPRPDLGDHTIQYCDAKHPATYGRGVGDWRRWEIRLSADDPEALTDAEVWGKLARWIAPDEATLERGAVYVFRSRVADVWSKGRVFIAGDAAHQMPPFMGQGMAAGVRDAANLSWKLSAVLAGADARLLDTYGTERAPNVHAFIEKSMALGRLINQSDPDKIPKGQMKSIWPGLGDGLGDRSGVGGELVAQVSNGSRRADDQSAGGFYVIGEGHSASLPVVAGAGEWLTENGLQGVVVRPDGYALGGYRSASELQALVAQTHGIEPRPYKT